ncbi:MAG: CsgG/HfaB family protein [Planctomycetota bacterium]|jgi:hypothetical protein
MKAVYICVLLSSVVILSACSSGESYFRAGYDFDQVSKIAVVDVVGPVGGNAAKNQISDFFVMELLKKGYAPIERAQVQSLLKEQEFQASEITVAEGAAQAGKVLNVPAVLVVNVPEFDDKISITAKMVDVEDASILWLASGSGKSSELLSTIAGSVIGAGAGIAVSGQDDEVIGGTVGGVLGGTAGHMLSPQKAEKTKEIIEKMCQSLPQR